MKKAKVSGALAHGSGVFLAFFLIWSGLAADHSLTFVEDQWLWSLWDV